MRNRNTPATSSAGEPTIDTDVDRYLSAKKVLRRLIEQPEFPDIDAELIEIRPQANGDVAYRVRPPRAEESEVGIWYSD